MSNLQKIKQQYIDSAMLHSLASAEGNYKVANKQALKLKNIYLKIENCKIDYNILLELLDHADVSVQVWAAAHLLGLNYEVKKAENRLLKISEMHGRGIQDNMRIFAAKKTLEEWKVQGCLKF